MTERKTQSVETKMAATFAKWTFLFGLILGALAVELLRAAFR